MFARTSLRLTRSPRSASCLAALSLLLVACGSSGGDVAATTLDTAAGTETTDGASPTTASATTGTTSTTLATVTSARPAGDQLSLEPLTNTLLTNEGVEAVGCWFHEGDDVENDAVFFSGYDGGFFMVNGALVQVDKPDGNSFGVEEGVVYTNDSYEATFSALGEPVNTSIESTEQDATLQITPGGQGATALDGILWCGV